MEISIDASQINQVVNDIMQMEVDISQSIPKGLQAGAEIIQKKAQELAPVYTGGLQQSIGITIQPLQAIIEPAVSYAKYAEGGRGPGGVNVGAIMDWAESKGLPPWAVIMSIKKHGTRPHPFMAPALDQSGDTAASELLKAIIEDAIDIFNSKGS